MSTNSYIGKKVGDKVKYIYSHWDGYPSHNGAILLKHYSSEEKIDELLALGDISILGEKVNPDPDIEHTFENRQDNITLAYHRDRGDDLNVRECAFNAYGGTSVHQSYNYLFVDGEWLVSTYSSKKFSKLIIE